MCLMGRKQPMADCGICHGTGLVGGGATLHELYVGLALVGNRIAAGYNYNSPNALPDDVARSARNDADALIAALDAREAGHV